MHLPKGKLRNLIIGDFSGDPEWSVMSLAGFGLASNGYEYFSSKSARIPPVGARFFSPPMFMDFYAQSWWNSYAVMIQKPWISQKRIRVTAQLFLSSLGFKHCRIGIFEKDVSRFSICGYMAIPILALIQRTIPLNSQASAIRLTIFSAMRVTSASCLTSNNRHINSSPPQRLTVSSSRLKL